MGLRSAAGFGLQHSLKRYANTNHTHKPKKHALAKKGQAAGYLAPDINLSGFCFLHY